MHGTIRSIKNRLLSLNPKKIIKIGDILWIIALFTRSTIGAFFGAILATSASLVLSIKEKDILSYIGRIVFYPCYIVLYIIVMIKNL